MSKVSLARLVNHCCWPECGAELGDEDTGPPMCRRHVMSVAGYAAHHLAFDLFGPVQEARRGPDQSRRAEALVRQSQVYYVRIGDRVKIGYTGNLKSRLNDLRLDADAVLAAEPGGREVERERHLQFTDERVGRREDFNPSRRLLDHIAALREKHGDPVMTTHPTY